MEEDGVHRLEGTSGNEQGGLIIKKKKDATFKIPKPSLLGLDRLAAEKRKEKEDAARKMSFSMEDENISDSPRSDSQKATVEKSKDERKFRSPAEETPTYTGGVTREAQERLLEREKNRYKEKGVYATTKEKNRDRYDYEKDRYRSRYGRDRVEKGRESERERDRTADRNRVRDSPSSERHGDSSRRDKTPRFRDEPNTPNIKVKDSMAKTSWDEDDDHPPSKRSTWDYPTPNVYKKVSDKLNYLKL